MQRGDRAAHCLLLLLGFARGSPGHDREEGGCWEPLPGFVEDTLFRAAGASGFGNAWPGWYAEGHFSASGGDGKRPAYDALPLKGLRFSDSRGGWARYALHEEFDGLTLLQIVQRCMGSDRRSSRDGGLWESGRCTLGLLCASAGLPGAASSLVLGLGGLGAGPADWALLALASQPGRVGLDEDGGTFAIGTRNRTASAPDPTTWVSIQGLGLPGLPVHRLALPDDSEAAPPQRPEPARNLPAFLELQAPEELSVEDGALLPRLLTEVTARSDASAILAIRCSPCPDVAPELAALHGVSCSFRRLGEKRASLQLRARSLPLGVLSCNASDARGATGWSLTDVRSSRGLLEAGSNGTANDTDDSDDPTTIPPDAATTVAPFTTTVLDFDDNETSTTTTADEMTTTMTATHTRIVATTPAGAVDTTTTTTMASNTLPPNTAQPPTVAPTIAPTVAPTAVPTTAPTLAPLNDTTTTTQTTIRTTVARTTATATTPTSTVTTGTTVTVPPVVVVASMEMQVTQAAIFLTDDRAADAVRSTVAAWLSVPTNIVAVSLSAARRLRGGRRLQQEGKVRADIELAYPAGQELEAERAKAAVPMAFTKWNMGWLQEALDVWCGAGTYAVSVLSIGTGGTVVLPPREREPGTDWGDYVSLTLLILAVILLCCIFCFFYYRRQREDPRQIVLEPEPKAAEVVETVPLKAAPAPAPMPSTSWKKAEDLLPLEPSPKRIYDAEVYTASERGSPSQTPDEGGDWNSLTRSKKKQRTEESPPETLQPLPRVPENLKQTTWI